MLPKMKYSDSNAKRTQIKFGRYNHTKTCCDGEIYSMTNMSSDDYPVLSPRQKRRVIKTLTNPKGIGAKDALFYADNGKFYYDGKEVSGLTLSAGTEKQFAVINKYVVIFPDKKYYNTLSAESVISVASSKTYKRTTLPANAEANDIYLVYSGSYRKNKIYSLYKRVSGEWVLQTGYGTGNTPFKNDDICLAGKSPAILYYYSEAAAGWIQTRESYGNLEVTYKASGITDTEESQKISGSFPKLFEGDGVVVTGCDPESNNKTAIIRSVSDSGIYFDTGTFSACNNSFSISRRVPDMDYICEWNNRLWGCKGDKIYASKLGDPFNFNVFDGISTDSYAVEVSSPGEFTGCTQYLGRCLFFKENYVHTLFGNRPSNYQLEGTVDLGVAKGSSRSLALADGILFYHSPKGIVAFSGNQPHIISNELGHSFSSAVAGSTGTKYYVSMNNGTDYELFVYDTEKRVWTREDELKATGFTYFENDLFCICEDRVYKDGKLVSNTKKILVMDKPKTASGTIEEPKHNILTANSNGELVKTTVDGFYSEVEFGDFYENSPDKKGIVRYQVRLEVESGAEVNVLASYDSGDRETLKVIPGGNKRSVVIPIVPRRCDHFRIIVSGNGNYTIHTITREEYMGSEV